LLGYGLELVAGDADFADEFDREMRGAGVLKLGGIDGGVRLGGGRKRGAKVRSFLHGVEDRVADFFPDHFAERAGAEEFAERAVSLDLADFGIETKLRVALFDGGRQADGNDGIAGDDALGLLLPESFHAGKTFVVKLDCRSRGGRRGCECGLLDRNALTAAVVFIELRAQERREVFLQTSQVGGELQAECVGGRSFRHHRDCRGHDDVSLLILDGEGDFLRWDFERSVLRRENCRPRQKQHTREQRRARASSNGSPGTTEGIVCAGVTRYRFRLGEKAHLGAPLTAQRALPGAGE
jgi:hypothetical protein